MSNVTVLWIYIFYKLYSTIKYYKTNNNLIRKYNENNTKINILELYDIFQNIFTSSTRLCLSSARIRTTSLIHGSYVWRKIRITNLTRASHFFHVSILYKGVKNTRHDFWYRYHITHLIVIYRGDHSRVDMSVTKLPATVAMLIILCLALIVSASCLQSRIIGGTTTTIDKHPYQVSLRSKYLFVTIV